MNIDELKTLLPNYLMDKHNVNTRRLFTCLNPEHEDRNPSMSYSNKYNICKCFGCGVRYDIFDLIGLDYGTNSFKEQYKIASDLYRNGLKNNLAPTNKNQEFKKIDYTDYYKKCEDKISKTNYLKNRSIPDDLIKKYHIGFDDNRNMIVFPINKNCYFARSTINNDKIKSNGTSDIWNKQVLIKTNEESLVFVTEGIIDSLSLEVIDPEIKTLSINGLGNKNSLLELLKKINFKGTIAVCFDNDRAGIKSEEKFTRDLILENIKCISASNLYIFDNCTDPNDALINNKSEFENRYNFLLESIRESKNFDNKNDDFIL